MFDARSGLVAPREGACLGEPGLRRPAASDDGDDHGRDGE